VTRLTRPRRPRTLGGTPRSLGYRFPAEWEPHQGTWLSWPRPEGISFPDKYHTVPQVLAGLIGEILRREDVHINVPNGNYERIVRGTLDLFGVRSPRLRFHHIPTNECWCRDHGPAFVVRDRRDRRQAAVVDWGFNAWGGKYPPWDADDAVPTAVARELGLPVCEPGIVMEGGAVDFNGAGTVLTTTSCLLNRNRNPGLPRAGVERCLLDFYGQRHVVWLGDGIAGDDTDGHVDDLARFVDARTVVTGMEDDPADENHRVLKDNRRRLEKARDQDGRPLEIVEIPMPRRVEHEGLRLPATYLNFYFVNGAVLVPTYRDRRTERRALSILRRLLPGREVVGIDCTEIIWGLGAIHCLTQQVPAW
jgi:agmatine deiminase